MLKKREKFTIGRTIAGPAHRSRTVALEREAAHKRRRRRNVTVFAVVLAGAAVLVFAGYTVVQDMRQQMQWDAEMARRKVEMPEVNVFNENAGSEAGVLVNRFVAQLERDASEVGLTVDHVVLPLSKLRQIKVFLKDRVEYYKLSLDRGSAEQAEDMARVIRYLDENAVECEYVDLRVAGRAYYK